VSFIEKSAARENVKSFDTENRLASSSNQFPVILSQGGLLNTAFIILASRQTWKTEL
jgi:hypothetical protein